MKRIIVKKGLYYDSVFLMLINSKVNKMPGVVDAVVSMGTEMNVGLLREIGFESPEVDSATPNDLLIAVEAVDEGTATAAIGFAENLMKEKEFQAEERAQPRPASLDSALKILPDANFVIISLPGDFAAMEARKALQRDLHVMLFSDNVPLEDEIELKELASEKGLLIMGPDCGTAIINGKPLCFANVVRRGNIGIVGASGTGIQEVCCNIDRFGGGISQAIGTGGRDLKNNRVGGMTTLMGIEALKQDPETHVIVVISKPPATDVATKVMSRLMETGKPCVVHFIGLEPLQQEKSLWFAENLEETAGMAVSLSKGERYKRVAFAMPDENVQKIIIQEASRIKNGQKYLRGLFTGGTLADEAIVLFEKNGIEIYSNIQTKDRFLLVDPHSSVQHTIVDLGDDTFTVGRPHPMIDPSIRVERILKEMEDPKVAVLLLDMVLGYGSHPDPAGAILESLVRAKEKAEQRGGYLCVVASVTGTEGDLQDLKEQRKKLEGVGCVVMSSNIQASTLALKMIRKVA